MNQFFFSKQQQQQPESTWGVQGNSAPIGWSPSNPSVERHGSYPPHSGFPPQAQVQATGFTTTTLGVEPAHPGGFIQPSGSPTSPGSGVFRMGSTLTHHPGGFAPQLAAPPNVQSDECFAWFVAVDQDGSGQVSPEELRSALLNDGGFRFSTRTVKYIMSIFVCFIIPPSNIKQCTNCLEQDLDESGGIGFQEFEPLWNYMNQWRQMFDSFDIDHDNRIDGTELGRALAYYNLHVGPSVLDILVKKYGTIAPQNQQRHLGYSPAPVLAPRLQVDLDHFVCACVVVQQMCGLYDRFNQGGGGGAVVPQQMSRDEFLIAVISLP
ncbi:hypothetical protein B0F90DRAFT_1916983 [Multifurca ochricompacta]|uniref:EF-hand domain-containing protein n=1 Tax=Multifurca ochricompacta TaxID=376703 RepID=A0AAD4M648_9AGAM|nr:hypothetical protein B0F90DRAFT_1916983 [Multifurca ochricompacta]